MVKLQTCLCVGQRTWGVIRFQLDNIMERGMAYWLQGVGRNIRCQASFGERRCARLRKGHSNVSQTMSHALQHGDHRRQFAFLRTVGQEGEDDDEPQPRCSATKAISLHRKAEAGLPILLGTAAALG